MRILEVFRRQPQPQALIVGGAPCGGHVGGNCNIITHDYCGEEHCSMGRCEAGAKKYEQRRASRHQ